MTGNESEYTQKEEKLSLTDRFITAMFLPKEYGKLLRLSGGRIIQFLVLLILLVSVIRYAVPALGAIAGMGGMKDIIMNRLPAFSLEKGSFTLEKEVDWADEVSGVYLLVDTDTKEFQKEDVPENMVEAILVGQDNLLFYNQVPGIGGMVQEMKWKDMGDFTLNNEILAEHSYVIYMMLLSMFVFLYIAEMIKYAVSGLLYAAVMLLLVRTLMLELSFAQVYKTAIFAQTVGAIVNAVMYCINIPVLILAGSSFSMLVTVMLMNRVFVSMRQ